MTCPFALPSTGAMTLIAAWQIAASGAQA